MTKKELNKLAELYSFDVPFYDVDEKKVLLFGGSLLQKRILRIKRKRDKENERKKKKSLVR